MTVVIVSGIFLVAMVGWIMLRGNGGWQDDTTTSYNGRSYQSARTAKEDRWG
jgi:hypothetical protein